MRAVLLVLLVACAKQAPTVGNVTVDELAGMLDRHAARAVDANGETTRKRMGVVPGALLIDTDAFDPARQLGGDKDAGFVFYCANTTCGASHEAAEKALTAGYTNVKVLPEGIAGWVGAHKPVQSI